MPCTGAACDVTSGVRDVTPSVLSPPWRLSRMRNQECAIISGRRNARYSRTHTHVHVHVSICRERDVVVARLRRLRRNVSTSIEVTALPYASVVGHSRSSSVDVGAVAVPPPNLSLCCVSRLERQRFKPCTPMYVVAFDLSLTACVFFRVRSRGRTRKTCE